MRKYNKAVNVGTPAWWQKWTQLEPATGCLLWTGFRNSQGYVLVNDRFNGRKVLAHRLAYEQAHGPIPDGAVVCHVCDVPYCVNPDHLFAGTQKQNLRDMFAKGRGRPRGVATAPLTQFPAVSYRVIPKHKQAVLNEKARKHDDREHIVHLIGPKRNPKAPKAIAEQLVAAAWAQVRNVPPVRPTQAIALWEADASNPTRWLLAVAILPLPNSSRRDCGSPTAPAATTEGDHAAAVSSSTQGSHVDDAERGRPS